MRGLDIKSFVVGAILAVAAWGAFQAQAQTIPPGMAVVVATCGTLPNNWPVGSLSPVTINTTGKLCNSI